MTKLREQQEARRLRALGWSRRQIAAELQVAVSSVCIWVQEVELPPEPKECVTEPLEPLRQCGKCRMRVPLSSFNRHRDGRQHWCRDCFREYFRARGALHRRQVRDAQLQRREIAQELVAEHLATHPCVDCGETDAQILEFDHIGPKRGNVSTLAWDGLSLDALRREIEACEVVCVNCHRRRTAHRGGSWRLDPYAEDAEAVPSFLRGKVRNRAYVRDVLVETGCVDCGNRDLLVLDFDHRGNKTANVSTLVRNACSLARLQEEIDKCDVRCANCHRRRTTARKIIAEAA